MWTGFFSVNLVTWPLKCKTTSERHFTHSVDLFPDVKFISWLYWKGRRRSPKVRLNWLTIPWSLGTLTFSLLISLHHALPSLLWLQLWIHARINIKNFWPSVWCTLTNILKNSWDLSMASLPFSSQPTMWSLRNFCTCYYEVNNLTWITCITVLMHFELWELKYAYYIRMMSK